MEQTFSTLAVATAATGIGLGKCSYSDVQQINAFVLGHPVWTHELADRDMNARAEQAIREQLPDMPSRDLARSDWEAASKAALSAYGDAVTLRQGSGQRTEGPLESLTRLTAQAKATS